MKKSNVKKCIYDKRKKLTKVANIKVEEVTILSSEASTESGEEDSSLEEGSCDDVKDACQIPLSQTKQLF